MVDPVITLLWILTSLEVVDSFCCLGDSISAGGGCEAATTTRVRAAWGKFRKMLPILSRLQDPVSYNTGNNL